MAVLARIPNLCLGLCKSSEPAEQMPWENIRLTIAGIKCWVWPFKMLFISELALLGSAVSLHPALQALLFSPVTQETFPEMHL